MNIDPNSPAFPVADCDQAAPGLTIRAHFAAMAMTGAATTPDGRCYPREVADAALALADALLAALNKEEK